MLMNARLSNAPVSTQTRAVLCYPLMLGTHLGVKIYNRTFRRVDAALFLADVLVLLRGRASSEHRAEIAQVNTVIEGEFQRLDRFLADAQRRIEKRFNGGDTSGNPSVTPTLLYTQPVTLTLTLRTPRARLYADLLARLEKTLEALDGAWYANQLSTVDHLQQGHDLFRNFYRTCGIIERLAWGLGRRVREADDGLAVDLPDYHAILLKRTKNALAQDGAPELKATQEATDDMTTEETQYLEVTEALVSALTPTQDDHPDGLFDAVAEPINRMERVAEDAEPVPDSAPQPWVNAVQAVEDTATEALETPQESHAAVLPRQNDPEMEDTPPVAPTTPAAKRPRLQDAFRRQGVTL